MIRTPAERLRRPFFAFEDELAVLPEAAVNASNCAAAASVALLAGGFSSEVDTGSR
ncbi:MAG TPA: hypothetical protein VME69_13980 [Methylocella sp.]|nr:hypothetical protein [Methylocella sp.]